MVASARRRWVFRCAWLTGALLAIAAFGVRAPAQAPPSVQYGLTPLGALGGAQSAAYDISDFGSVISGRAQKPGGVYHAFVEGYFGLRDLGTLGGGDSTAFASSGTTIVGQAQTASGTYHAFSVDLLTNEKTDLGTLGGNFSAAYDTKDAIVVGASRVAGNARLRAFQYMNGAMMPVPVDTGGDSAAKGVSNAFDTVGYTCTTGSTGCRPFVFASGAATLIGPADRTGVANGISDNQQVVGSISTGSGVATHAFLYATGLLTDLGTLGGTNSEGRGVNLSGHVVGSAQNAAGQPRAFVWRDGHMSDLNTLLVAGSGWVLESAAAISDADQIAGYGTYLGKRRAFLLTPATDVELFIGGARSQTDSNFPHGIEVGKHVRWVTSALGAQGGRNVTVFGARMVHTLTGPAVFVDADARDGDTCDVSPTVVTCQLAPIDTAGIGREISVRARAIGPGAITHRATLSSSTPDPNPANNSISEENRAVALSTFTITPVSTAGGQAATGEVVLTDLPPAADALVSLKSSRPDIAPVPAVFDMPAFGGARRQFHIVPSAVTAPTIVKISATFGLVTVTKTLTVLPSALRQLYLTPTTVIGGCGTADGKILLTGVAPDGGAIVPLSNTNGDAAMPAHVTVPAGSSVMEFVVATTAVTANVAGRVTASFGGVSQSLTLTVRTIRAKTLSLSATRVRGGATVSGAVALECPAAPGAVTIRLTSSNGAVASPTVPSLTLAAGAASGVFSVRTSPVTADTPVAIDAWVFGVRKTVTLVVTP